MAKKVAVALSAALAVGAANIHVAVHRSLRQHHNQHGLEHPLSLITFNTTYPITEQGCGPAVQTSIKDMKNFGARCPESCPLWVDTSHDGNSHCNFACVSNSIQSCKDKNPLTPVADAETGVCRRCQVTGCFKCQDDGSERCAKCMEGYQLKSNGGCGYTWGFFIGWCCIILLLVVVLVVVLIIVGWIVDLWCRESVNKAGLEHALDVRSRAKIHMPKNKLFLKESSVKATDSPNDYEVIDDCTYFTTQDEQQPSNKTLARGDIVTGKIEDGWFQKDARRKLWPLTTNLCKEDVAGPAVTLLFNFQAALVIWAFVIVVTWKLVASFTDEELLTLGKKASETERQNCIVVQWGYETQKRLMYVKVGFLLFTYLFSFLGAIIFGIRQWRIYTSDTGDTHRDFCAVLTGLPAIPGDVLIEDELKKQVESVTGKKVIGVSVGWEARDKYDDFESAMNFHISEIDADLQEAQSSRRESRDKSLAATLHGGPLPEAAESPRDAEDGAEQTNLQRIRAQTEHARRHAHKMALHVEGLFVHPVTQALVTRGRQKKKLKEEKKSDEEQSKDFLCREEKSGGTNLTSSVVSLDVEMLRDAIKELHTASTVFVVFESEFGRDAAVEAIENGMEFRYGKEETCTLFAEIPDYEPQSVLWQNLSSEAGWKSKVKKVAWMFGVVLLTCMFLATFEYGYAIIQINNVRSSGEEGITLSFLVFTILVASMMACLCAISATVADMARFERVGHRETCFVLLYTFSVILQVSLDAAIGYFVGKNLMEANGIRTHDGTLIADLKGPESFTEIFGSYAMQKHIGVTILSFGFPCAFLVPFLIEPIVSIFLPYKIMSLLVASHPELKGNSAEGYIEAVPMDLGRYGDCMINVIIASMILWFPSGFNLTMFTFLFLSHCYIYLYDHYRVLRSVASVYIATYSVDFCAQCIFSIPCAIICGALAFKLNCEPYLEEFFSRH